MKERIVEELDVQELVAGAARHPYTVTLLRASETYGEGGVPAAVPEPHDASIPEPRKT